MDYLGWDLMEPVTYSLDSFIFLYGVYYYVRYKNDPGEWDSFWEYFNKKKMQKLKIKFEFD